MLNNLKSWRHIDRDNSNEIKIRLVHNVTSYSAAHNLFLDFVCVTGIEVLTAVDIADAVLAATVEGSLDLEATLRLILAATTGSSDGAGTGTFEYKSVDGATTRIRSTFDVDGNRQITLLDAS